MSETLPLVDSPGHYFADCLESGGSCGFRFKYCQYYLPDRPVLELAVVVTADLSAGSPIPYVLVTDNLTQVTQCLESRSLGFDEVRALSHRLEAPLINLAQPFHLKPVNIPKPWGQEVWYTGIESRGQSCIQAELYSVPLPWVLGLDTGFFLGSQSEEPNLLKILDPLPEEVYGDLYFELHEKKQEVYVVTHVDSDAWPSGQGGIRFGFDQKVRARFSSDSVFREAFHDSVKDYEDIRRQIDAYLDQLRLSQGVGLNEPVSAQQLSDWLDTVPAELLAIEKQRREAMNGFTAMVPLQVADVVKVPTLTPHALQHGVRTIEFQTPVYERKIVSFAQKVLTQQHWDTAEAIGLMSLDKGSVQQLPLVSQDTSHKLEQVVQFDDFEVVRLTLSPGAQWEFALNGHYGLVMAVVGEGFVSGLRLMPEEACLVPAYAEDMVINAVPGKAFTVLIAFPRTG